MSTLYDQNITKIMCKRNFFTLILFYKLVHGRFSCPVVTHHSSSVRPFGTQTRHGRHGSATSVPTLSCSVTVSTSPLLVVTPPDRRSRRRWFRSDLLRRTGSDPSTLPTHPRVEVIVVETVGVKSEGGEPWSRRSRGGTPSLG